MTAKQYPENHDNNATDAARIRFLTVAQWCQRWQISRRKFDLLKAAGALDGIIQPSPRFIRIRPDLADASLEKYMTGGAL